MARVNVDTNKMRECGSNIVNLSKEYLSIVNALFTRLSKVNENGEWSGLSADKFIENVNKNKNSYISLGNQLKRYGDVLIQSANNTDSLLKLVDETVENIYKEEEMKLRVYNSLFLNEKKFCELC